MSIVDSGKRNEQERQAMQAAEDAREETWTHPSFCEELFAGSFQFDLIYPFPEQPEEDKKKGTEVVAKVLKFLEANLDPNEVEEKKLIPAHVMQGLKDMGLMGIKIPKEYGGLGLSQTNYNRIVSAVGSYCASTAVMLSAHQSIGVPQPLKVFGTEAQKKKYLPRLAKGEISAFALTEEQVGSDPVTGEYILVLTEGSEYALNVGKENYLFVSRYFDYQIQKEFNPVQLDIYLDPIKTGASVVLNNIFFEQNSVELEAKSIAELDKLISFMQLNSTAVLELGGHTDDVGSDEANIELSRKRAKAVYDYILTGGISNTKLKYKGYGETKPLVPNTNDENRAKNRRIEFKVL